MGKKNGSIIGSILALGTGVAAGWTLRKIMQRKYDEISDLPRSLKADSVSDKELITTLFDNYSTQMRDYFADVQDQIKVSLNDVKNDWQNIDKRKYRQLVDEAIKNAQTEQKVPQKQIERLRDYLMADWDNLRSTLRQEAEKTKSTANKK